jgi:hypothetical protein
MYSTSPHPEPGPRPIARARGFGRQLSVRRARSIVMSLLILPTLVLATVGVFGLGQPAVASASTPPTGYPAVVSVGASPGTLPAQGGTVSVQGRVANAESCQLQVLSSQSFAVIYSHNPRSCSDGAFSAQVTIGPNNTSVQRTVAFALVASNHGSNSTERFYVLLGAPAPAAVVSLSATPPSLSANGGIVSVVAKVQNASMCQLRLLSAQAFAVVYSHNARACTSGAYSAQVTIGPNNTSVQRTVAFALVAFDNATNATDSADRFYVLLSGGRATGTSTSPPPGSTTVPPSTTTVPSVSASSQAPATMDSSNWSGYATSGGPYTEVKGTFTVPGLAAGTRGFDQVSEWVGVDGANGGDGALIQAGVDEYPDPEVTQGYDIQPWWEILPAAETSITTLTVKTGDSVSVTIWKLTGTTWEINLSDHTNGQSFTSPPEQYSGLGSTAEWIVEATSRCRIRCETTELAPYTPAVSFSNLGMTGPEGPLEEISMVQAGTTVSTPSGLTSGGFDVTYTGMQLAGAPIRPASRPAVQLPGIKLNSGFARVTAT